MNKLQKFISESKELFDKEFAPKLFDENEQSKVLTTYLSKSSEYTLIKSFLKNRQLQLWEVATKEEWKRCVDLLDHDHLNCPNKESCIGYQNAQSDLMNQPPEIMLKNLEDEK